MSSDDLTQELPDAKDKTTQPMIADVFRLVEEVKQSMEARFDATNARLDATNARLDQIELRIEDVNIRLTQGFRELTYKIDALNRRSLQTEANYESLSESLRDLQSKAS
jgi:hypothetical protein